MNRAFAAIALLLLCLPVIAQQDATVKQQPEPQVQQPAEQQQTSGDEQPTAKKKRSKVARKIDEAIPDCVNLIFYHGCRSTEARQQDAEEKAAKEREEAAERCKQLEAARPKSLQAQPAAPATSVPAGESSSRTNADLSLPYCTGETVLAAEHDVDVGDFNFKDKNYRGAEMRYRSALEQLPGDPIASLHLARLLEKLGRNAEALQLYQQYMAWSPTGKDAEEAQKSIQKLQAKS